VDYVSLQKVVLNLLANAVKFTPRGGTVSLLCEQTQLPAEPAAEGTAAGNSRPRLACVITVADTGVGISEEFLPHVFEPFMQEQPENADTSGSGMGLSIVRHIVDAMGGTIEVSSKKGAGTVFTVRFCFEELDPESPPQETVDKSQEASLNTMQAMLSLSGKQILVCEDNALNMEIIRTLLENVGMKVTGAENGRIGTELFGSSRPGSFAAGLLDLRMPVMDGITAARDIRAMNRSDARTVPLIAVSADAFEADVENCRAAGMNGHIAKPVDPALLYQTLEDALKQQGEK